MTQVSAYSRHPLAQGLPGTPRPETVKREQTKAENFKTAFEAVSGMMLENRARDPGLHPKMRAEALEFSGQPHLSRHQCLERNSRVSSGSRSQAKELFDTGLCDYVESAMRHGKNFADGERDREDRVRQPAKQRAPKHRVL